MKCDFCASSILLTPYYAMKPVDRVTREIREIKRRWRHPFIELADDNSFANPRYRRRLVEAIGNQDVKWFAETDISVAEDTELLALIAGSGCRQLLVGFESPNARALDGLELRSNWKYRTWEAYLEAIERIQSYGITVNGCFVLGLDGDTEKVFDDVPTFVEESGLFDVQVTVMTPFPGTPLYRRLASEDRLIEPGNWRKCTLFDVNYEPLHMTTERLEARFRELVIELYREENVRSRHRRFLSERRNIRLVEEARA